MFIKLLGGILPCLFHVFSGERKGPGQLIKQPLFFLTDKIILIASPADTGNHHSRAHGQHVIFNSNQFGQTANTLGVFQFILPGNNLRPQPVLLLQGLKKEFFIWRKVAVG